MELRRVWITESPSDPSRRALVGEVHYADRAGAPEEYWYEVPAAYAGELSTSGNPWLTCLLPLAAKLGEPLRLCAPVDGVLLENAQGLLQVWQTWYPYLHVIPIEAEVRASPPAATPGKTAAFFSGGVDSFFTVLRHAATAGSSPASPLHDLLTVWGFDVPLNKPHEFRAVADTLHEVASVLDLKPIPVATNVRSTRFAAAHWTFLAHGSALASIGHALEKRYQRILIASSQDYKTIRPLGSHPLTDPLASSGHLQVIHDGAMFDRVQKTEYIAGSDLALRMLRVCVKDGLATNCCRCNKCYRTMTTLALLGVLERSAAFAKQTWNLEQLARVYSPNPYYRAFFQEIYALAVRAGRPEVAQAVASSLRYSRVRTPLHRLVKSLYKVPLLWRFREPLERALLARAIF